MDPTLTHATREQRRAARVRVRFRARYVSSTLTIDGHVTDVSPDGLFFCSDFLDARGETVRIWVALPGRQPLELRGEVRWVNDSPHGGGMGVRLIDVTLDDRAVLTALEGLETAGARLPGHA